VGIGFVLMFWSAWLTLLALGTGLFFAVVVQLKDYKKPLNERLFKWGACFAGPLLGVALCGAGWFAYAAHCEFVRGVDPGLGDAWYIPLSKDYKLLFIDDWDHAWLQERSKSGSSDQIESLADAGDFTAVRLKEPEGYRLLSKAYAAETRFDTRAGLEKSLAKAGHAQPLNWQQPEAYFMERRHTWVDTAWGLLVLLALLALGAYYLRFIFWEPPLYQVLFRAYLLGEDMLRELYRALRP
jgi:hypothetical protein